MRQAWRIVEKAGLQDYFLYPAINWNFKSVNIKEIAKRLNIRRRHVRIDRRFAV